MPASFLYVPGDQPRLVDKALHHRGAIIVDLEDSVAPSRKGAALSAARDFLAVQRAFPTWVRVNPGTDGVAEAEALRETDALDGIWLAKAEDPDLAAAIGAAAGVKVGVLVETAKGILALPDLLRPACVVAVQLGEIDLSADLGHRGSSRRGLECFRNWAVLHAVAAKARAVGPVSADFRDLDAFRVSTVELRDTGFTARACIHPAQVEVVDEVFGVSDEELEAANRMIDTYETALREGRGAYGNAGAMVDAATIRQARALTGRL